MTKFEEWFRRHEHDENGLNSKNLPSHEEMHEMENDLGEHIITCEDEDIQNAVWALHAFITALDEAREGLENKLAV